MSRRILKQIIIVLFFTIFTLHSQSPIPIFYGLNESQSNSWAQVDSEGNIGIVYCYKQPPLSTDLVYRSITTDNEDSEEFVTSGSHLENSVLFFDSLSNPHIFIAKSTDSLQTIEHFYKEDKKSNYWEEETIYEFNSEYGKFIYEMSGDIDKEGKFHLLLLVTRSNPDSDDYYFAFMNANLLYLTNSKNSWQIETIRTYHTLYTLDEYSKMLNRQDLKVDSEGKVHIIYGEQMTASMSGSPARLCYTTNSSGNWEMEVAAGYAEGSRDDGGWYSSLAIDSKNKPHISCTYIRRYSTGSAINAKLLYIHKDQTNNWTEEVVATRDDGYYGTDGRNYTGGITDLKLDKSDNPHIIFSDIASSHAGMNFFNLGNIRYAIKTQDSWEISKIYSQELPFGFYNATEMYDMCLLLDENRTKITIVGQELVVKSSDDYTMNLLVKQANTSIVNEENFPPEKNHIGQNYPNPFNPQTIIDYCLSKESEVLFEFYNVKGELILWENLGRKSKGNHNFIFKGNYLKSGTYFCRILIDGVKSKTLKLTLVK